MGDLLTAIIATITSTAASTKTTSLTAVSWTAAPVTPSASTVTRAASIITSWAYSWGNTPMITTVIETDVRHSTSHSYNNRLFSLSQLTIVIIVPVPSSSTISTFKSEYMCIKQMEGAKRQLVTVYNMIHNLKCKTKC